MSTHATYDVVAGSRLLADRIRERGLHQRIRELEDACRVKDAALVTAAALIEDQLDYLDMLDRNHVTCAPTRQLRLILGRAA
jgi:hypothetical protein